MSTYPILKNNIIINDFNAFKESEKLQSVKLASLNVSSAWTCLGAFYFVKIISSDNN